MNYDVIVIGAGPSGLFTACNINKKLNGLILERNNKAGIKLLMSGAGQCNITHGGNIKDFLTHYGNQGKKIRQILYKFNNQKLIEYFNMRQVDLFEREDQKIFPKSLDANEILSTLIKECKENQVKINYNHCVENIQYLHDKGLYEIQTQKGSFYGKNIVIATGGCSYPTTGSDGSIFKTLESLDIKVTPLKPALVPVYVNHYPYGELSGISLKDTTVSVYRNGKKIIDSKGDLLFTHKCFSGPVILNLSRYIEKGDELVINYFHRENKQEIIKEFKNLLNNKNNKKINTLLREYVELPKRLIETILQSCKIENKLCSQINHKEVVRIFDKILMDRMKVHSTGGYNIAMVTRGGIDLDHVNLKDLSSQNRQNLYFVGEVLDVDGDTGGFNLQFAFSSAVRCANAINQKVI